MQKGSHRALAYKLATSLSNDDLNHISGGQAEASTRQSVSLSGANIQSSDVQYDVVRDFDL